MRSKGTQTLDQSSYITVVLLSTCTPNSDRYNSVNLKLLQKHYVKLPKVKLLLKRRRQNGNVNMSWRQRPNNKINSKVWFVNLQLMLLVLIDTIIWWAETCRLMCRTTSGHKKNSFLILCDPKFTVGVLSPSCLRQSKDEILGIVLWLISPTSHKVYQFLGLCHYSVPPIVTLFICPKRVS